MNWRDVLTRELGATGETLIDAINAAIEERLENLAEPEPTDFKKFVIMKHHGQPDLGPMDDMKIFYESAFFDDKKRPGDNDFTLPSTVRLAEALTGVDASHILIDIERWWTGNGAPMTRQAVEVYKTVLSIAQQARRPEQKIGLYGTIPVRNYWAPVRGGNQEERWKRGNDILAELGVDFTAPSIYTFYDSVSGWLNYAKANVDEAKRLMPGKPCYPVLWPWMHPGNGRPVPRDFFTMQLNFCREYADGVIVWDDRTADRRQFDDLHWWDTFSDV